MAITTKPESFDDFLKRLSGKDKPWRPNGGGPTTKDRTHRITQFNTSRGLPPFNPYGPWGRLPDVTDAEARERANRASAKAAKAEAARAYFAEHQQDPAEKALRAKLRRIELKEKLARLTIKPRGRTKTAIRVSA